ncbi:MBL fold hydrolase [Marivirga tractuosa]|uniref:Beta-lactamase domain-containing protein n=1 Tax=Marivirga tractuosa (strain ATCC 23168 / DSM 4126 / NBRC 15989 / NCIMB 1408 / VKM B-1430 / H-43) TaxID=643867 RepID=E4TTW0_MARTH|nr:MBL fold metallo-hydrolase [Marivirga tractuosa]ADR22015.1 beta-lactamase domain-containing protein [Marivirga tractuosa DSM 4126]BDD13526.1 MBL fold hydrolase [Marivirga tractuosa]
MQKIAKDVFHIPLMPRNSINCYIIEGVLVDSGIRTSYNKIQKSIKEVSIHSHALTHAHPDHQGCSDLICKKHWVPLLCHEKEVVRTETGLVTSEYPSNKSIIARFQQRYWAGSGHIVTKTLKNGDSVEGFKVIETPGHSSGHISFFRERDGVLILGDVATNMNLLTTISGLYLPPAIFTSDKEENINSLKELSKLNPRIICFGHGPVLKNNDNSFEKFVDKVSV